MHQPIGQAIQMPVLPRAVLLSTMAMPTRRIRSEKVAIIKRTIMPQPRRDAVSDQLDRHHKVEGERGCAKTAYRCQWQGPAGSS